MRIRVGALVLTALIAARPGGTIPLPPGTTTTTEERLFATLTVPSTGQPVFSPPLTQQRSFRLEVSGTVVTNTSNPCVQADMAWVTGNCWTTVSKDTRIGLVIDGLNQATTSVPYASTHVYSISVAGAGQVMSFLFSDTIYTDNSGFLTVRIYVVNRVTRTATQTFQIPSSLAVPTIATITTTHDQSGRGCVEVVIGTIPGPVVCFPDPARLLPELTIPIGGTPPIQLGGQVTVTLTWTSDYDHLVPLASVPFGVQAELWLPFNPASDTERAWFLGARDTVAAIVAVDVLPPSGSQPVSQRIPLSGMGQILEALFRTRTGPTG